MSPNRETQFDKYLRIPGIGLKIDLRADFLALTAFILSIIVALYQLTGFLVGPNVVLFSPPQILLRFDGTNSTERILRIGARMAFINSGQLGYNASIAEERVEYTLDDRLYIQKWQTYQSFSREGNALVPLLRSDAHPIQVNAGGSVSHETYFAPHPERCHSQPNCQKWRNNHNAKSFLTSISRVDFVDFLFVAQIYGSDEIHVLCRVDVDRDLLLNLTLLGWAAPRCWPSNDVIEKRRSRETLPNPS
ncbi:MAG: hypothetical protein AAGF71_12120 [Pseudomonadota bacterium]